MAKILNRILLFFGDGSTQIVSTVLMLKKMHLETWVWKIIHHTLGIMVESSTQLVSLPVLLEIARNACNKKCIELVDIISLCWSYLIWRKICYSDCFENPSPQLSSTMRWLGVIWELIVKDLDARIGEIEPAS